MSRRMSACQYGQYHAILRKDVGADENRPVEEFHAYHPHQEANKYVDTVDSAGIVLGQAHLHFDGIICRWNWADEEKSSLNHNPPLPPRVLP